MFIDESLTGLFFCRIEGVDLGDLWDKGVFQFNGMVKRLLRGKNIASSFRKDILEISTEVRDWDLLGFLGSGKLSRDCDFINLFC